MISDFVVISLKLYHCLRVVNITVRLLKFKSVMRNYDSNSYGSSSSRLVEQIK